MKLYVLLVAFSLLFLEGCMTTDPLSPKAVVKVTLNYDSLRVSKLDTTFQIGLKSTLRKGTVRTTKGFNQGWMGFWRFKIWADHAKVKHGELTIAKKDLQACKGKVRVFVQPKNNPAYKDSFDLQLPYLSIFRVNVPSAIHPGEDLEVKINGMYSNQKVVLASDYPEQAIKYTDFSLLYEGIIFIPE